MSEGKTHSPYFDLPTSLARSKEDQQMAQQLVSLLASMDVAELERFYRGVFLSLTCATAIFQDRFPEDYARVDAEITDGEEPLKL